ncbi:MAG: hypothetical protein JWO60_2843 [Frankiales bacterium]|nr:hypothetical protein [Frankiales bacterium]
MRLSLLLAPVLALTVVGGTAAVAAPAPAPAFASAARATVHPGVQTYTRGAQCTANFVYTAGSRVFLGQSAHCAGLGEATDTDGCTARSLPLGTAVEVEGATRPGRLVYSSWIAMQRARERGPDACAYNDFALVELAPADVRRTNPSVPFFGGPTGLAAGTRPFADVFSYGDSSLRLGLQDLSPKRGVSLGDSAGGWTTDVYTATPGIPGDSGSGFLTSDGRAFGTLSTVALAPLPLSNGVSNLSRELAYARRSVPGLTLVKGTTRFSSQL